jgi:hypothetical protein
MRILVAMLDVQHEMVLARIRCCAKSASEDPGILVEALW